VLILYSKTPSLAEVPFHLAANKYDQTCAREMKITKHYVLASLDPDQELLTP